MIHEDIRRMLEYLRGISSFYPLLVKQATAVWGIPKLAAEMATTPYSEEAFIDCQDYPEQHQPLPNQSQPRSSSPAAAFGGDGFTWANRRMSRPARAFPQSSAADFTTGSFPAMNRANSSKVTLPSRFLSISAMTAAASRSSE